MLVTWKYRDRGKFLYTLDPRARWFASFFVLFSIIQFWDLRYMLFFFVLGMIQYFMTGLKWQETKRVWMLIILLVVVIVGLNALLSGRGGPGEVLQSTEHKIWEANITVPLVNWELSHRYFVCWPAPSYFLSSPGQWTHAYMVSHLEAWEFPIVLHFPWTWLFVSFHLWHEILALLLTPNEPEAMRSKNWKAASFK